MNHFTSPYFYNYTKFASPEESKLKNKIKIVREEDKATWV